MINATYAHCSILASACNIAGLPFLFAAFPGSTNFIISSLGGMSGGLGADAPQPIDESFPERKRPTACFVLSTLSCGCDVLRIRTAHWISVFGGSSMGTMSSLSVMRSGVVDENDPEITF